MAKASSTSDAGMTKMLGDKSFPKFDARVVAIGEIDELSCHIGVAMSFIQLQQLNKHYISTDLMDIQTHLFELGAELALTPMPVVTPLDWLEEKIQNYESHLPKLTKFIYPGGTYAASHLHLARAVARRAERTVCSLVWRVGGESPSVLTGVLVPAGTTRPELATYLNRLSDLLFLMARHANAPSKAEADSTGMVFERTWKGDNR